MIIHNDIQLDFDDVLIAPQTTTINHRGEVDVVREYKQLIEKCQKDSITYIKGCPIISSNMTQTGTFEVAEKLLANKCFASLHKFYSASNIISWMNSHNCEDWHNLFITVGIRDKEKEINKLTAIKVAGGHFSILVDVPNAYIPNVLEYIKELRNLFPDNIIAVGNVCTGDETQKLILAGANLVKVGIGPSCFTGHMKIQTDKGVKKIKDIELGDKVLTHKGNYKEVINKFEFSDNNEFIKINNIECTPNHEFYVCNKSDINKINENNYQEYCFWKEAKDLNEEYMILKIID